LVVIEDFQVSPSSAEWNSTITFSVRCSDPDGDPINVMVVMGLERWPMRWVGPSSFKLSWIPGQGDIGTHSFYIEVCDGNHVVTTPLRTLTVEKRTTSLSLSASSSEVHLGSGLRFEGTIDPPITGVAVRLVLAGPENRIWQKLGYTQYGQFASLWKTSPRMISDSGRRWRPSRGTSTTRVRLAPR
jgi:hypothetical protein